jgi:thioredoxin reductase
VTTGADGRLAVDDRLRVAPGLYAAGAVRAGWAGRAVASAGDGALAAITADADLRSRGWTVAPENDVA